MKCVVVGAGPSGMFAAGILAEKHDVTLVDKNEKLGKKLFITGKGRCNVTNNSNREELINNIVTNPKFVLGALSKFSPQDTMSFIESFGCELKTERGNRVFPVSDKSSNIIKVFEKFLNKNNVDIKLNTKVLSISKNGDKFIVKTNTQEIVSDIVVVATGGVSYPLTGSTGDGYNFAKKFGHKIVETKPGLSALLCKGVTALAGLSLKNVKANILVDGAIAESEFGEMLFTHEGVSGPIILSLSSKINKYYVNKKFTKKIVLSIDLKPALDEETLNNRLVKDLSLKHNQDIKNILQDYMPSSLIPYILKQANIQANIKGNSITKLNRESLIKTLKGLNFIIDDMDKIDRAIITSGGVDVKDINPKDMQSKIVKGLYFIGEVLDIDALTGGFNIQLALSTAYTMAKSLI